MIKIVLSVPYMRLAILSDRVVSQDGQIHTIRTNVELSPNEFRLIYSLIYFTNKYKDKPFKVGHEIIDMPSANVLRQTVYSIKRKIPKELQDCIVVSGRGSTGSSLYQLGQEVEGIIHGSINKKYVTEMGKYRVCA